MIDFHLQYGWHRRPACAKTRAFLALRSACTILRLIVQTFLLSIATLALAAQPRTQPDEQPLPKPDALFASIRKAYRAGGGPIAESIRIVVRRVSMNDPDAAAAEPPPPGRRAVLSLMMDPSTNPAPADGIAFRLRGSDRIWIQAGLAPAISSAPTSETASAPTTNEPRTRITASGSLTRGPYFQHEVPGPLTPAQLSEIFPPLPLPQLALAFTPLDQPIDDLTPYARGVAWTAVRAGPVPRATPLAPDSLILEGACRDGSVLLTVHSKTFRIRSASFVLRSESATPAAANSDATQILIEVVNRSPTAERWVIETEGRPRATALDGLASSATTMPEGRTFPLDALRSWSGEVLSDAARPGQKVEVSGEERPELSPERIVLLIANQRTAAADPERSGATLRAIASSLASLRNENAPALPAPTPPRPEPGTPRIARFETHFVMLLPSGPPPGVREGGGGAGSGSGSGGVGELPDWANATFSTDPPLTTNPLTLRASAVPFADPGEEPVLVLVLAMDGIVTAAFTADAGDATTADADIATQLEAALLTTVP